ncbi:MAG: hypothetical protein JSR46_02725 [Verrucomicrobia bacterium]|nr:hypothetical protein [Verrucomicrobiota bacterium]
MGVVSDTTLQFVVDCATTVWNQQHANSNSAKVFDQHANLANKQQADQWLYQISRNNRTAYVGAKYNESVWLNSLRHFLKPIADWSKFYNPKHKPGTLPHGDPRVWTAQLFDPIHFHHYNNPNIISGAWGFNGQGITDDPTQYWRSLDALEKQLVAAYPHSTIGQEFTWNYNGNGPDPQWFDPTAQQAPTDIVIKNPDGPTIEGFGIAQFLEWLTGLDYFQLFAYEYSFVLILSLVSIAWTDFYPFFVEIGWVQ